ncbi:hypothetical protein BV20DRAFT_1052531 [Pilatotrama ljubarskyi]|nr:hypothetical protein BV20DRAFT_1052531 [Pilatotrama ljubarskyi]
MSQAQAQPPQSYRATSGVPTPRAPEYYLKSPNRESLSRVWWYTQPPNIPRYSNCLMCRVIHVAWITVSTEGLVTLMLQDLPEHCCGSSFLYASPVLADVHVVCLQGDLACLNLYPPRAFCPVPTPSFCHGCPSSGAPPAQDLRAIPGGGYIVPPACLGGEPPQYVLGVRWPDAAEAGQRHAFRPPAPVPLQYISARSTTSSANQGARGESMDVVSPASDGHPAAAEPGPSRAGQTQAAQNQAGTDGSEDAQEGFETPYPLLGTDDDPPSQPEGSRDTVIRPESLAPLPAFDDPHMVPRSLGLVGAFEEIEEHKDSLKYDVILRTRLYQAVKDLSGAAPPPLM